VADVARATGSPAPTRQQIVSYGEQEEERQRQQAIQQSRSAQVGQAAFSAGKGFLVKSMGWAASGGPLSPTAPAWLYGIIIGFERLGMTLSETNRDLDKFDESIADSFARLDYARLHSRQQVATATGGSASFLNNQLAALVREMQPMRETVATFLNVAGGALVKAARVINFIFEWHPTIIALRKTAEIAENIARKFEREEPQAAAKDFLRAIRDGKFSMPRNPPPGK
jgi:hypothetical protein